jgi:ABC-type bacteriocin/lantibiotic exporter with double-glycine peptidase domain
MSLTMIQPRPEAEEKTTESARQGSSLNHEAIRACDAEMGVSTHAVQIDRPPHVAQGMSSPDVPRAAAALPAPLLALCIVARLHNIPADPAALLHFLGKGGSEPVTVSDVLLCAKNLGLKATRARRNPERLPMTPLPAIALMRDGSERVLAQCDSKRVLSQVPGQRPMVEPLDDFVAAWSGELLLFTSRASLAGDLAKFDFSWFVPSIVRQATQE